MVISSIKQKQSDSKGGDNIMFNPHTMQTPPWGCNNMQSRAHRMPAYNTIPVPKLHCEDIGCNRINTEYLPAKLCPAPTELMQDWSYSVICEGLACFHGEYGGEVGTRWKLVPLLIINNEEKCQKFVCLSNIVHSWGTNGSLGPFFAVSKNGGRLNSAVVQYFTASFGTNIAKMCGH
jgi:hypothetical protein